MRLDHRRPPAAAAAPILLSPASGCASFVTVSSAEVIPGPAAEIHVSASTPPGEEAGWFWSTDCGSDCDRTVPGGDPGITHGWGEGAGAMAFGIGTSAAHPHADGYLQLTGGRGPAGVGVRIGPPVAGWRKHQICLRQDLPVGDGPEWRLFGNTAIGMTVHRAGHTGR